jgi:hypothetical protein
MNVVVLFFDRTKSVTVTVQFQVYEDQVRHTHTLLCVPQNINILSVVLHIPLNRI